MAEILPGPGATTRLAAKRRQNAAPGV